MKQNLWSRIGDEAAQGASGAGRKQKRGSGAERPAHEEPGRQ